MLRPQTRDYIEKLSDQELFEYICQEDYEPEAIAFGRSEFDRRKLNFQQVEAFANIARTKADDLQKNANDAAARPLSGIGKIFAFIAGFFLGLGLPGALVATLQFRQRGETRKSSELWSYFGRGLLALLVFAVVLFMLPVVLRYFG